MTFGSDAEFQKWVENNCMLAMRQSEPLACEACSREIGYVFVGDGFECSSFYCKECVNLARRGGGSK